jgi:DNA-directed RNA polymerase subunit K/omega
MSYFSDDEDSQVSNISGGDSSDDEDDIKPSTSKKTNKREPNELDDNELDVDNSDDENENDDDDSQAVSDTDNDTDYEDLKENETNPDLEPTENKENKESKESKKKSNKSQSKSKNAKQLEYINDEDDDEDDDDDENYLQKFDQSVSENYVLNNHPECIVHNYKEVLSMCSVIRDANGIIIDDLHKTIPYLTKYERAKILGVRTKQIDSGATPFIKLTEGLIDGYIIAEMELKEKKIPFIIKRPMPNGGSEYWFLKDLEDLSF